MFSMMGNCMSWMKKRSKSGRKLTLGIFGIDNAGKTVTTKGLQGETFDDVTPTVGFQNVDFNFGKFDITLYDLGGGKNIRGIWKSYYSEIYGLVYVIDSSEADRITETKEALMELLSNEKIQGKPVLLLANKQDKEGALDEIDICEYLALEDIVNENKCPCRVEMCSATLGSGKKLDKGIKSGFQWLLDRIDADYEALDKRVSVDVEKQNAVNEQARKERLERVKKIREEREKREAEERALRGEPEPKEESDEEIVGDPFKTVDVAELAKKEERMKAEKEARKKRSKENFDREEIEEKIERKSEAAIRHEVDTVDFSANNSNMFERAGEDITNKHLSRFKSKSGPVRSGSPIPPARMSLSKSLDFSVADDDDDDDDVIVTQSAPRRLEPLDGSEPAYESEKKKKKKKKKVKKNQTVPVIEEDENAESLPTLPPAILQRNALPQPSSWNMGSSPPRGRLQPLGDIQPRASPRPAVLEPINSSTSRFDSNALEKWGLADDLPQVSEQINMHRLGPNAEHEEVVF